MPKHYCDYCDVFLTHDSTSVRKAHNSGRNHLSNVRDYYASLGHDKAQNIIDQITQAYESGNGPPPGGFGFTAAHLGAPVSGANSFGPPPGYGGVPQFGPPPGFGSPAMMMSGPRYMGPPSANGPPPPQMMRPPFPPGPGAPPPGAFPPFPPNGGPPRPGGLPFPAGTFGGPPPGAMNGGGPPPPLPANGIHPDRMRMMGGSS